VDSLAKSWIAKSSFSPLSCTPSATSTGIDSTRPPVQTRTAIASRKRQAIRLSWSRVFRHSSKASFRLRTTRLTALLDSGASFRSGRSAPRIRRLLAPLK
jgi:hypothetical protein